MKYATILFVMMVFASVAWPLGAQSRSNIVSLDVTEAPLAEVIGKIEAQTSYLFVYNVAVDLQQKVTVHADKADLDGVLADIFARTPVTYQINGSNITLIPKSASNAEPQVRKLTGHVFDAAGNPIAGAYVLESDTYNGTTTDFDGAFELVLQTENPVLRVEFLGFVPGVVNVEGRSDLTVVLQEDAISLEGTVVTALGIRRSEKALNYSVQNVKGEDILAGNDVNFVNSLNGRVAGVTINASSSGAGGESKVVMRGQKSISQSSNALYVIDGVPILDNGNAGSTGIGSSGRTDPMSDINPENIESISVLTGAAAAALYGSNAANGAVVITTKKGAAGKTELTVSSNTEVATPIVLFEFQNRYANLDGQAASWGPLMTKANTYNPVTDFYRTGITTTENVTFTTGNDHNQVFASVGAVNTRGIVPNNVYRKYNFTIRNTSTFLKDRMHLDLGASYIIQYDRNRRNQGIYANPVVPAYLYPRGENWDYAKTYEVYDAERNINVQNWEWMGNGGLEWDNPYWTCYRNLSYVSKKRYMFNAGLTYDILDWLKIAGRVRVDNSVLTDKSRRYATTNTVLTSGSLYGYLGDSYVNEYQTYGDVLLMMDRHFGRDWSVNANVGASIQDMKTESEYVSGPIREGGLPNVWNYGQVAVGRLGGGTGGWHDQTQSVFGSVEVGFKGAAYLTGTARNDWASQLAGSHSLESGFFYWSLGGSLVLNQIIPMGKAVDLLKVHGSWASVGLPFKRYIANPTYSWNGTSGSWETSKAYPVYDLKPERTKSWEIGLSFKGLGGLSLDFTYYDALTYNQTFDSSLSVSSGYSTLYVQTGEVRNRGIELGLGYEHRWGKFGWNTNATLSMNRNRIEELMSNYVHPETGAVVTLDELNVGGLNYATFILRPGGSLGDVYTSVDLFRDSNGNPYISGDGQVSRNTGIGYQKLGSVFPKANLAWNNNFSFGNFNFGALVTARIGGIVYSATQAYLDYFGVSEDTALAREAGGVQTGDFTIPAQNWYQIVGAQGGIPQYYTYDATNIRISEAHIGYTIPKKWLGNIVSLDISVVARNLLMIYCKAPFDPESVASSGNYYQGMDSFMLPSTRNIGLSLRLKF